MDKIHFYCKYNHFYKNDLTLNQFGVDNFLFPCVLLGRDDKWNDYSFVTLFRMKFYKSKDEIIDLGWVTIIDKDFHEDGLYYTELKKEFEKLNKSRHFSIGRRDYYEIIEQQLPDYKDDLLGSLNDVIYHKYSKEKFERMGGKLFEAFDSSLLRSSESRSLFLAKKGYKYNFSFDLKPNNQKITIPFNFDRQDELGMSRINILIGQNGVGKTQTLSSFASIYPDKKKHKESGLNVEFDESLPFGRIIVASYSIFDSFPGPDEKNMEEVFDSYKFFGFKCGDLKAENIFLENKKQLTESIESIKLYKREKDCKKFLKDFIGEDSVDNFIDELFTHGFQKLNRLSSGESFLVILLINIIANLREDSLLLLDEIETHLHPNAILLLMRTLYKILEKYDSYAIIATHSPVIIQQTPAKYINIYEKIDGNTVVRKPKIETFGEGLDVIVDEVFGVNRLNKNYLNLLDRFLTENDFDEINDYFEKKNGIIGKNIIKIIN